MSCPKTKDLGSKLAQKEAGNHTRGMRIFHHESHTHTAQQRLVLGASRRLGALAEHLTRIPGNPCRPQRLHTEFLIRQQATLSATVWACLPDSPAWAQLKRALHWQLWLDVYLHLFMRSYSCWHRSIVRLPRQLGGLTCPAWSGLPGLPVLRQ